MDELRVRFGGLPSKRDQQHRHRLRLVRLPGCGARRKRTLGNGADDARSASSAQRSFRHHREWLHVDDELERPAPVGQRHGPQQRDFHLRLRRNGPIVVIHRSGRRRRNFQPFRDREIQLDIARQWRDVYDVRRARTADADHGPVFAEQPDSNRKHYRYRVRALRLLADGQDEARVDAAQERGYSCLDHLHLRRTRRRNDGHAAAQYRHRRKLRADEV